MSTLYLSRAALLIALTGSAYALTPLPWSPVANACAAAALALVAIAVEWQVQQTSASRATGGLLGALAGFTAALLVSLTLRPQEPFLPIALLLIFGYIGITVGAAKLDFGRRSGAVVSSPSSDKAPTREYVLDTSVIIDGRIADIAETGFIDRALAIPQFVLRELQLVADSADSLKRNRGRRGLDVLQRLQKMPQIAVQIIDEDFVQIREVDMKLVELGKLYKCKVVTNDFNLNKVAQLHGVEVLNINELANALKPVVLPGEIMRVFVLKEGKEHNQGVAYLDDGTMVVVDNARRLISKTIDISVTSVLQTTAGKMIFGRFDDRLHAIYEKPQSDDRRPRETSAAAPQP